MSNKMFIDIIARDKTKQGLNFVQNRLNSVKNSVFSLKGALIGLGAGAVVKSFVDVGKEVESLRTRFKFLFGSAEEGAIAFDNLTKFAAKVPFSLDEISKASGNLAVVANDATDLNRILEITGNVAAVTGLDFETTSSQIQRAFSGGIGAADLFRERGVRALLGFQAGAKVTAEETIARFEELFSGNGKFANATKDLSRTLEGTLSMIGDKYFKFQKDVAAGFFDELKSEFGDLNEFLEDNEQQIKDIATAIGENFAGAIQTTSQNIKNVAPAVKTIANALGDTIQGFASLPPFVQNVGLIGALLFGKKGAIALAGLSFFFDKITEFIDKVKNEKNLEELLKLPNDELVESVKSLKDINELIAFTEPSTIKVKNQIIEVNTQYKDQYELLVNIRDQIVNTNSAIEHGTKVGSEFANALGKIETQAKNSNEQLSHMTRTTNKMVVMGEMVGSEFEKALGSIGEDLDVISEGKFPRFVQALKDAGNTTMQLDNLFTNTFNSFADTLTDALMTGKANFKDFARSVIADIARIIAKQQAMAAIQKALGFFGVSNIGGVSVDTIFGGKSAGGRVNKGMPYMVGEAGSEIFVPQQSGTIIPNNKMGGMNINFTINTVDARGVDELLTSRRNTIVNVINDALNRQGKEALV